MTAKPRLLAGGNPQIPKGQGDGPVQAYIAAMPGWKSDLGRRLDALVVATVPDVHKAVKWNQPFYGHRADGWFLASLLHQPCAGGTSGCATATSARTTTSMRSSCGRGLRRPARCPGSGSDRAG